MSRVISTPDGMPVSESNPLPVKMAGGGDVDLGDYYTKDEVDTRLGAKANSSSLASKADKTALTALETIVTDLQAEVEALKGGA